MEIYALYFHNTQAICLCPRSWCWTLRRCSSVLVIVIHFLISVFLCSCLYTFVFFPKHNKYLSFQCLFFYMASYLAWAVRYWMQVDVLVHVKRGLCSFCRAFAVFGLWVPLLIGDGLYTSILSLGGAVAHPIFALTDRRTQSSRINVLTDYFHLFLWEILLLLSIFAWMYWWSILYNQNKEILGWSDFIQWNG